MMPFKIHFQWPDGTEDAFTVPGEDLEEDRKAVAAFFERRGLDNSTAWSEEIQQNRRKDYGW